MCVSVFVQRLIEEIPPTFKLRKFRVLLLFFFSSNPHRSIRPRFAHRLKSIVHKLCKHLTLSSRANALEKEDGLCVSRAIIFLAFIRTSYIPGMTQDLSLYLRSFQFRHVPPLISMSDAVAMNSPDFTATKCSKCKSHLVALVFILIHFEISAKIFANKLQFDICM